MNSGSQVASDERWMFRALQLAGTSVGISSPNPAVGCVIVGKNGEVLGEGSTQAYRGLHAERVAFQKVKNQDLLEGATIYVTLEPCCHHGNQPPCVDLILHSKVTRVVIARGDPDSRVNGRGIQQLRESGKEVQIGLLSHECTAS